MRLKKEDNKTIKRITKECFGVNAQIYLFGSRVDNKKRGGDIDLHIETKMKENIFEQKLKMIRMLHYILGEQKIDIVINNYTTDKFIFRVAKSEGVPL